MDERAFCFDISLFRGSLFFAFSIYTSTNVLRGSVKRNAFGLDAP
jgi:hypothetical protein